MKHQKWRGYNEKDNSIYFAYYFIIFSMIPYRNADAKSVDSVIRYSRKVYYGTNSKLKSFKVNQIKGSYKEYWDKKVLYKVITYPTSTSDFFIKNYTVEYYYHQFTTFINEILVAQSVVLKHS